MPVHWVPEAPLAETDLVSLRIWVSPKQELDWTRSELFLKELRGLRHRAAMEVIGNQASIALQLLCSRVDQPIIMPAFRSQFELCALSEVASDPIRDAPAAEWQGSVYHDHYPQPPCSHLLTRPYVELQRPPYTALAAAMERLPPPAVCLYQVVFSPARWNWHQVVASLFDAEYAVKVLQGLPWASRYAQPLPSADQRQLALQLAERPITTSPFSL